MIIKFVKFSKCETHIVCVKQRSNTTCNYLWTLILERPNNGPQHFRQSPRCQICLDVLIFFCKFMSGLLSTLQLLTIYKSRTQHNTTLLKGFCFTPLNLNLFSNSSFYLKGSSSYLHIYNSLQPTSCPALYCNLQIGYF